MPPKGMTARSMARVVARHLRASARIQVYAGKVNDKDTWTLVGDFAARIDQSTLVTRQAQQASQDYDSAVLFAIPGADSPETVTFSRDKRYRILVTEFKSTNETASETPQVKRTHYLESREIVALQDNVGTDFLYMARCSKGTPWPS